MAALAVWLIGFVGVLLRYFLFFTGLPVWIRDRREVVTPLTSWERVLEGIALHKRKISPYAGDIFHETPLLLRFLKLAENLPGGTDVMFIVIDIIIGILLQKIASTFARYFYSLSCQYMHAARDSAQVKI